MPVAAAQHIAAIAQRNGADRYPLLQHHGITGEVRMGADVFQQLGDGVDALGGHFVLHIGRGLGIEQQVRAF
ncbi:hypothetical protein BLX41_16970 [Pseudomonas protegens]|nr:hypothetical protein BLX41_16970 [Pseudomonas protegens]